MVIQRLQGSERPLGKGPGLLLGYFYPGFYPDAPNQTAY